MKFMITFVISLVLWPLFAAQGNNDFLVASPEDDTAIFDAFDRELIGLRSHLQAKGLAFDHGFAIDDLDSKRQIHALCGNRSCHFNGSNFIEGFQPAHIGSVLLDHLIGSLCMC